MSNEENIFFQTTYCTQGSWYYQPKQRIVGKSFKHDHIFTYFASFDAPKRLGKLTIFVKEAFEKEVFAGSTTDPHKPFGKLGFNKTIFWRIWSC